MNVLTDQEIDAVWPAPTGTNSMLLYARAIESALLQKLAAGVSVEQIPMGPSDSLAQCREDARSAIRLGGWSEAIRKCLPVAEAFVGGDSEITNPAPLGTLVEGSGTVTVLFTISQLQTAVAAARVQALEEADQAAGPGDSYQDEWFAAKADSSKRIRALLGGPSHG